MFKPTCLVVDTNILLYMFSPGKYEDWIFSKLSRLVSLGKINLVIPEHAYQEWIRLKDSKYEEYLKEEMRPIEKAANTAEIFRDKNKKADFISLISDLKTMKRREYIYIYGQKFRKLQEFINEGLIDIPTASNDAKVRAADMSVQKKPPFFGPKGPSKSNDSKKNEMDDALIFFTGMEYAIEHQDKFDSLYFVTGNTQDFSKLGKDNEIHENLEEYLLEANVQFSINIKEVLKSIKLGIEEFDEEFDEETKDEAEILEKKYYQYLTDDYFISCPKSTCDGELQKNIDGYWEHTKIGPSGLTWHYHCPKCNYIWDSRQYHDSF